MAKAIVNKASTGMAASARPLVFKMPLGPRLLSLFVTLFLGAISIFLIGAAILVFKQDWAVGLFMTAIACFVAALTGYVSRDLAGKWRLRIVLGETAVALELPAGRSLIHRPPARRLTIQYGDIEAIETRLEAYGSLFMEMMQRAYVLRCKSGDLIFLFEDRALATALASSFFAEMAAALATRAGVPLKDLGMVEAGGGLLGVWGAHPADWAAPSLPLARQIRLWRHAAMTGGLAFAVIAIALAARLAIAAL